MHRFWLGRGIGYRSRQNTYCATRGLRVSDSLKVVHFSNSFVAVFDYKFKAIFVELLQESQNGT